MKLNIRLGTRIELKHLFFAYSLLFLCRFFGVCLPFACPFFAICLLFVCYLFAICLLFVCYLSKESPTKNQTISLQYALLGACWFNEAPTMYEKTIQKSILIEN